MALHASESLAQVAASPSGKYQWSGEIPPGWEILPIPRYVDYESPDSFVTVKKVAVIRKDGGPYQSVRDAAGDLSGESTITEEELVAFLKDSRVQEVAWVADNLPAYDDYDTLIVLGNPERNAQTAKLFEGMGLSFTKWDDVLTPEHDFNDWKDFGKEGYLLKVGVLNGKNVIILAGYDYDDARKRFYGAGTFYAFQSLKQLIAKDGDVIRIKTAEVADRPLLDVRGCYTGWPISEEVNLRAIELLPPLKMNQNVFWYGSQVVAYNTQSASKFRYPWNEEQLEFCRKVGRYCREHFIVQVFGMNADHFNSMWATALTLDGKTKDPLHYDLNHEVEPGVKEMWAKIGYDVKNDVDVLAAKYSQLNKVCPTAAFSMFNEDDVFGLVHEDDKKLYGVTGDSKQDAINYGRARGTVLAALYKRIKELCPDSPDMMPICPPGNVAYQVDLESNAYNCRDFMISFTATLKELGVLEHMPVMTTGGGTAAEVTTNKTIDDFKSWCNGGPALISDNNFPYQHVGSYETDPNAPHSYLQQSDAYPAGYRDKELYKRVWGIWANGLTQENDEVVGWCTAQFMWNMPRLDKKHMDASATRKVAAPDVYPIVKSLYEEFDDGACYLADELRPSPPFAVSDRIRFAGEGWAYKITYTDAMRLEAQRLREKLGELIPQIEAKWKPARLRWIGYDAYTFCSVFLERGYIKGWEGATPQDQLSKDALRSLYLEADDFQQRFFNGPLKLEGRIPVERQDEAYAFGRLAKIITGERLKAPIAESIKDIKTPYVDIWKEGLQGAFFEPVSSVELASIPDGDAKLTGAWGAVEEVDAEKFRTVTGEAGVSIETPKEGQIAIRAKIGSATPSLTESTLITLTAGNASHTDAVSKPRWILWTLPAEAASQLSIKSEKPVRVYAIEVYRGIM
jgi:hypothetical protein